MSLMSSLLHSRRRAASLRGIASARQPTERTAGDPRRAANVEMMDTGAAIDRFLAHGGLSEADAARVRVRPPLVRDLARRATGSALDDVDARVLSDWVGALGSGRDRLASDVDLATPRRGPLVPPLHLRPGGGSRRIALAEPLATPSGRPEAGRDRGAARAGRRRLATRAAQPRAPRAPVLGRACEAPRPSRSISATSTSTARSCTCAARAERSASCRSARRPRSISRATSSSADRRSRRERTTHCSCRCADAGSTRAPSAGSSAIRTACGTRSRRISSKAAPTSASSRSSSGTRRSRRPRSTATSTPGAYGASTTARIRDCLRAATR